MFLVPSISFTCNILDFITFEIYFRIFLNNNSIIIKIDELKFIQKMLNNLHYYF